MLASSDPSAEFSHALTVAAQNLWFDKLLIQLGLDPNNLTYAAVLNRVVDIALTNINFVNSLALAGAALYAITLLVRTIVPLRVIGIFSAIFFIAYGALAGAISTFLLYLLSLPINIIRLRQMLDLVKRAKASAQGDLSMDWLRPYMSPRKYRSGDVLFHKGDTATELFLTVTGKFLVVEIDVELAGGRIIGELGFVAPENRRTQTVESIEDGEVLTITYEKLLELYFQNPEFGYYFLRLSTERLMHNLSRVEAALEASQQNIRRLEAIIAANTAMVGVQTECNAAG